MTENRPSRQSTNQSPFDAARGDGAPVERSAVGSPQAAFPEDIDVAIVAHNNLAALPATLQALLDSGCAPSRITLVDVAGTDGDRRKDARDGAGCVQGLPQGTAAQHDLAAGHEVGGHGPEGQLEVANVAVTHPLTDRGPLCGFLMLFPPTVIVLPPPVAAARQCSGIWSPGR